MLAQRRGDGPFVGRRDAQQPGQLPHHAGRIEGNGPLPLPVEHGQTLFGPGQFAAATVEIVVGLASGAAQFLQAGQGGGAGALLLVAGGALLGYGRLGLGGDDLQAGQRRRVGR